MHVTKRDGTKQPLDLKKITNRITNLSKDLSNIDILLLTERAGASIHDDMQTSEIDEYTAQLCASLSTQHFNYGKLAARISISNLHKLTPKKFSESIRELYHYTDSTTGREVRLINDKLYSFIFSSPKITSQIDSYVDPKRDFNLDYFGFSTLKKNYLLKKNNKIVETYQYLLMRVALTAFSTPFNLQLAFKAYDYLSSQYYTHATPTLFNSGLIKQQLASCFLLATPHDSVEGIYSAVKNAALISKHAGGLGISVSNVRAKGSYIKGVGGTAKGIIPYLTVLNSTMRYADQGGSRRPGACCIYLEPWHADVLSFLDIRKNTGNDENRCRDLFPALWVSDNFMRAVKDDKDWHLFCPSKAPGLYNCYGKQFENLYNEYVNKNLYNTKMKARQLMKEICRAQIETGCPFMLYKDRCNETSNQNNLGCIRSSNLCTEIIQFSSDKETAVCNLASINLAAFINPEFDRKKRLLSLNKENKLNKLEIKKWYDFEKLHEVAGFVALSLNNTIDNNYYPINEASTSNFKHRPIGIGVQGLADTFMIFKIPFDSEPAKLLNKLIFETIYHAALASSNKTAKLSKTTYSSFKGSMYSKGILHFEHFKNNNLSGMYDWDELRNSIKKHGLVNSLFTCVMPTASTAQILGNVESVEAITSNLYVRRVLAGDFICVNKHMLEDLTDLGIWNNGIKQKIMRQDGSLKGITEIPDYLQKIYRMVWEIPQKHIIEMSADRTPFIDQSQSLNIFIKEPTIKKIFSMHCFGWEKGLKTGMYYLRVKAATEALKFTLDGNVRKEKEDGEEKEMEGEKRVKVESEEIGSETSDYEPKRV